jgi:hypothetical protein
MQALGLMAQPESHAFGGFPSELGKGKTVVILGAGIAGDDWTIRNGAAGGGGDRAAGVSRSREKKHKRNCPFALLLLPRHASDRRMRVMKEQSFRLNGLSGDRVQNALNVYHDDVIQTLVNGLRNTISSTQKLPKLDQSVPLVLSGGTSMPKGFL